MNSKILLILFLGIFIAGSVSALSSVYTDFSDGTHSATITDGNSISFNADFGTVDRPMAITSKLFDSNDNVVYVFVDKSVSDYTFSNTYSVTKTVYLSPGSYRILSTITDKSGYSTGDTLSLTVNPVVNPPPVNHPPVITSVPVTQVNENTLYNYQMTATDADNDTLTYSLVTAPSWLSINSATGLISGTSPSVNSDTNYDIQARVSDGTNSVTQEYTLTVLNVPSNNTSIVITSPPVTLTNEKLEYDYQVIASGGNGNALVYSLVTAPSWLSINSATGFISGIAPVVNADTDYNVTVQVSDGTNTVTQTYILTVRNVPSGGFGGGGVFVTGNLVPLSQTTKSSSVYNPAAATTITSQKSSGSLVSSLTIVCIAIGVASVILLVVIFLIFNQGQVASVLPAGRSLTSNERFY
ncbi:MAG TPA: putative Ig domain-containing protein [Patescibacteria group bacterium]|nr:putative Ig domain-containing protein [Patescibacteria group bacterium]